MPLSIERARKDAKALRAAWAEGDKKARQSVKPYFNPDETPTLAKAQLVVARRNLFSSWAELVGAKGVTRNDIIHCAKFGDADGLRKSLAVLDPFPQSLVGICINPLFAAEDEVVECVRLLLEAGCDPNAAVLFKKVPHSCLWGAEDRGYELIAAVLREYGATREPASTDA